MKTTSERRGRTRRVLDRVAHLQNRALKQEIAQLRAEIAELKRRLSGMMPRT